MIHTDGKDGQIFRSQVRFSGQVQIIISNNHNPITNAKIKHRQNCEKINKNFYLNCGWKQFFNVFDLRSFAMLLK